MSPSSCRLSTRVMICTTNICQLISLNCRLVVKRREYNLSRRPNLGSIKSTNFSRQLGSFSDCSSFAAGCTQAKQETVKPLVKIARTATVSYTFDISMFMFPSFWNLPNSKVSAVFEVWMHWPNLMKNRVFCHWYLRIFVWKTFQELVLDGGWTMDPLKSA